ncbi:MAG: leucine-rich repeat domain-containing protein [Clostridia bacterium]|nr:leucine-rich repeat domain-containing protein [Clostridia bacterium]
MKKALAFLLLAALLATPLTGCDKAEGGDEPDKTTTESKDNGDNIPEYNAADANPASDFEYEVGEDGGITITRYIGTDTTVVIPEKIDEKNVTVIGEGAFHRCDTITSVSLPDTLTCIGRVAFAYCTSLKHIRIPAHSFDNVPMDDALSTFVNSGLESVELAEGIKFIPNAAFANTKLKEVVLPNSIQKINRSAFEDCTSLHKVTLNEGLTSIGVSAFGNTGLTEIVIPKSVKSLWHSAFEGATALQKVYFEGNAPEWFMTEEKAPFTVYYHEGATGFTTPKWNGYTTEIW